MDTTEIYNKGYKETTYFVDTSVFFEDLRYLDGKKVIISPKTYCKLREIADDKNARRTMREKAVKALGFLSSASKDNIDVYDSNFEIGGVYELEIAYAGAMYIEYKTGKDNLIKFATSNWMSANAFRRYFAEIQEECDANVDDIMEFVKKKPEPEYFGYVEVHPDENEMAEFYENINVNIYNLLVNQYLIIYDGNDEVVDVYRWDGETHVPLKKENVKSNLFGTVKPYKGDVYQRCLFDSFATNQITMVKGNAGTGKTACALGYLMYLLEKHKIEKILIFTNTLPTLNAARLGFYPGTRDSKLLTSSVGNILASKFGDSIAVERMIADNKLMLVPMCDIRGYDTTGMNAGILITEAQNLDIHLMKLALQRIGEDSVCIIDGDYNAQVDNEQFAGDNNGMRRLSQVFRGSQFYGEIELKNIYRSRIADLAEKM